RQRRGFRRPELPQITLKLVVLPIHSLISPQSDGAVLSVLRGRSDSVTRRCSPECRARARLPRTSAGPRLEGRQPRVVLPAIRQRPTGSPVRQLPGPVALPATRNSRSAPFPVNGPAGN